MNRYGLQLMRGWEALAPSQYAMIKNPQLHFTNLGQEVLELIEEEMSQISGSAQPGESLMETVGRINAVRQQIEEVVLAGLMPDSHESGLGQDRHPGEGPSGYEDLDEYLDRIENPETQLEQFKRLMDELDRHQST